MRICNKKNSHYFDKDSLIAELIEMTDWCIIKTVGNPTAYGEYAPYHFVDTEQEFQTLVKGLRP